MIGHLLHEKMSMLAKHSTPIVVLLFILPAVFSFSGEGDGYTGLFTFNSFAGNGSSPNAYDVQVYGSALPVIHGSGSGYELRQGTIYLRQFTATNVSVGIGNTSIWSDEGMVLDPQAITEFNTVFQDYLTGCTPDEQGYCLVLLRVFTGTPSSLKLSQVSLSLVPLMNRAPTLNLTIVPEQPTPDDTITCRATTYDLNDDLVSVFARVSLKLGMMGVTEEPIRELSCVKVGLPGIYECTTSISAEMTQPGHEVTCAMQAFDGELSSEWVSATVIVGQSDSDMVHPIVITPVSVPKTEVPPVVITEPQEAVPQHDSNNVSPEQNHTDEIPLTPVVDIVDTRKLLLENLSPIDLFLPNLTKETIKNLSIPLKQLREKRKNITENDTTVIQENTNNQQ